MSESPNLEVLHATLKAQFDGFRAYLDEKLSRVEATMETLAHKSDVISVQNEIERLEIELADVRGKADKANAFIERLEGVAGVAKWLVAAGATGGGSVGLYELGRAIFGTAVPPPGLP